MPIPHENQIRNGAGGPGISPTHEIEVELKKARQKIATDRLRQAMTVGFQMANGRFDEIKWDAVQKAFADHAFWQKRVYEFETEKQFRFSMAFGSLLFVLLGPRWASSSPSATS